MKTIGSLTTISELHLEHGEKVTNKGVRHLVTLEALFSLTLKDFPKLTDQGVECFTLLTSLTQLSFPDCPSVTISIMNGQDEEKPRDYGSAVAGVAGSEAVPLLVGPRGQPNTLEMHYTSSDQDWIQIQYMLDETKFFERIVLKPFYRSCSLSVYRSHQLSCKSTVTVKNGQHNRYQQSRNLPQKEKHRFFQQKMCYWKRCWR